MLIVSRESLNLKLAALEIKMEGGHPAIGHLHRVLVPIELEAEAQGWCQSNFGDNWIWARRINYTALYFKTPEDAFLFSLRFGIVAST
jgi:hypothetical protein